LDSFVQIVHPVIGITGPDRIFVVRMRIESPEKLGMTSVSVDRMKQMFVCQAYVSARALASVKSM
jgi:hypothetical protein